MYKKHTSTCIHITVRMTICMKCLLYSHIQSRIPWICWSTWRCTVEELSTCCPMLSGMPQVSALNFSATEVRFWCHDLSGICDEHQRAMALWTSLSQPVAGLNIDLNSKRSTREVCHARALQTILVQSRSIEAELNLRSEKPRKSLLNRFFRT